MNNAKNYRIPIFISKLVLIAGLAIPSYKLIKNEPLTIYDGVISTGLAITGAAVLGTHYGKRKIGSYNSPSRG